MPNLVVFGPPGPFSAWVTERIREAISFCGGADVVHEVGFDEGIVGSDLLKSEPESRILILRVPNPAIEDAVEQGFLNAFAIFEDPVDCVNFIKLKINCSLLDAIRSQTAGLIATSKLRKSPSATTIRINPGMPALPLLRQLIQSFPVRPAETSINAYLRRFPPDLLCRQVVQMEMSLIDGKLLDPPSEKLVLEVLAPMIDMAYSDSVRPIRWMNGLFLSLDLKGQPAPLSLSLVGPARAIYFGPYLYLPAGLWDVQFLFGCSKESVGNKLFFRIQGRDSMQMAYGQFAIEQHGIFSGSLILDHRNSDHALELQFGPIEGALQGWIALAAVEFLKRADGTP